MLMTGNRQPTTPILLNGKAREVHSRSVADLLCELNLLPTQVAVEHNGIVLFRHELQDVSLNPEDRIEIIRVVAGG